VVLLALPLLLLRPLQLLAQAILYLKGGSMIKKIFMLILISSVLSGCSMIKGKPPKPPKAPTLTGGNIQ
jgi:hypothetical protein